MTIKVIPEKNQFVEVFTFPDGQPHVRYTGPTDTSVDLVHPIRNPNDFVIFLLTLDALKRGRCHLATLYIPYMMGARSDREMQPGDSVCGELVLKAIEQAKFARTHFLDIHNEQKLWKISGARNILPYEALLREVVTPDVIIRPDSGAAMRAARTLTYFKQQPYIVGCEKKRDEKGKITLVMDQNDRDKCKDKICLIVDDLCDGGGTFLAIADQIEPKYLTLVVTHGIFSKGLDSLTNKFNMIVTTNSFCTAPSHEQLKVIDYNSLME
jgi:ribose-phosphate pyrophosphokinase